MVRIFPVGGGEIRKQREREIFTGVIKIFKCLLYWMNKRQANLPSLSIANKPKPSPPFVVYETLESGPGTS